MGRSRRPGRFGPFELARIAELYPSHGEDYLAMVLRRSPEAVRRKALEIFAGPRRSGPWSAEEDRRLRLGYGVLDLKALAVVLRRTQTEVRRRLAELRQRLRQGDWDEEEERLLKRLYGSRSDRALEIALLRPRREIAAAADRLCLAKDKRSAGAVGSRPMPRWTPEEVATLRRLYPDRDNLELARVLGRSVTSVANKASQLGLRKSRDLRQRTGRHNIARRYRGDAASRRLRAAPTRDA